MRVLHFINDGKIGGQERALYQLLRAFRADKEIRVAAAIGRETGLYVELIKDLGIPVINLNLKDGYSFNYSRKIVRRMREFDIHHFHDPSPNYVLYSLLAGSGIRRVFTRRGGRVPFETYGLKKRVRFQIQRMLFRAVMNAYSGNTANATNSVKEEYGLHDKPVHVLYNGIDFHLLQPSMPREEARAAYGLAPDDFVVGTACRLVDWKRVDLVIRAFDRCRVARKKLLVFGDGPEREPLEALVGELGLGPCVRFAGMVPSMADCYQILDAFVLASTDAESFGNAVVEAMFARVPSIVMADSTGLLEHVRHLETGYVADGEGDVAGLLERIHERPSEAGAIAAAASASVVEKYSYERTRRAYSEFYYSVCGVERVTG